MTTRTSRLSLRQLATQLGVSQPFLSQIRGGKRPLPESLREKLEALNAYHLLITNTDKQVPSLARNGYNEPLSGCNSGVECLLPKQNVVGSNPITRSNQSVQAIPRLHRIVPFLAQRRYGPMLDYPTLP